MGLSRARGVALIIVAVLAIAVGVGTPATAQDRRTAPSVSLRQSRAGEVAVSGRTATVRARVKIDRYTGSGWRHVKRVWARQHRYATTLRVAAGTTAKFRVTSNRRSRTFVVRMAAPAAKTLYDACGARPRKADGSAWSCTFDDEFDGTTLDRTKWIPQTVFATGSPDTYACYRDDPANVHVGNGVLGLTLMRVDTPVDCGVSTTPTNYVSGMVSTWHRFSQQYGRFEARIKNTATTLPGLHEAFWMWPDDRVASSTVWPEAGEMDVSETYSAFPDASVPFLHYSADAGGQQPGVNTAYDCVAHRGEWNTYALEWSAKRIEIFVNGKSCLVNTSGDAAFQKAYIIDLTQSIGASFDAPVPQTPIPATMQVDYVRAWR